MHRRLLAGLAAAALVLVACGGSEDSASTTAPAAETSAGSDTTSAPETTAGSDGTITVPDDYATIQEAVDAAVPGDLILVQPGTYQEAVQVELDGCTRLAVHRWW